MQQPVLQVDTAALSTRSGTMPKVIFVAEHGTVWQVCRDGLEPLVFSSAVALACAFDLDAEELVHRAAMLDGWRPTHVLVHRTGDELVENRVLLFLDADGQVWGAAAWLAGVPGKMAPSAAKDARWYVIGLDEYLHRLSTIIAGCAGMESMVRLLSDPGHKPLLLPCLNEMARATSQARTLAEKDRAALRALGAWAQGTGARPATQPT